jgi:adenine-specific DNA-methyltransferase
LAGNTRILQLIDFGDAQVFTAISYPTIVILQRIVPSADDKPNEIRALNWQPGPPIEEFADLFQKQSFGLSQTGLKSDGWRLESSAKLKLLERIRAAGTPLGEYVNGRFYYGIKTGLNEAFVVDRATRDRLIAEHPSSAEILKPFLRGRDVKRWRVEPQDLWLIFTRRGIDIKKYPAILNHLKPYKKTLIPGIPGGRKPGSYEWFEIQDNIAYWKEFEQGKIVIPAISDTVNYAPDIEGFYTNDKTNICIPMSVHFVLAILNSQVSFWFSRQTFASRHGGFYEFKPMYVTRFTIPEANPSQHVNIEKLCEYIVGLSGQDSQKYAQSQITHNGSSFVQYFEQLLNGLVYELFSPDDLHSHKINLFKLVEDARLPVLTEAPEKQRFSRLEEIYERISNDRHPIRGCLESLKSIEVVRIIEGEE